MPQAITRAPWARRIGRDWEKEFQRYSAEQEGLTGRPISDRNLAEMTYGLTQSEVDAQREHMRELRNAWIQKKNLEAQDSSAGIGGAIGTIAGGVLGTLAMPGVGTAIGSTLGGSVGGLVGKKGGGGGAIPLEQPSRTALTGIPRVWPPKEEQAISQPVNVMPQVSDKLNWETPISNVNPSPSVSSVGNIDIPMSQNFMLASGVDAGSQVVKDILITMGLWSQGS